MHTDTSISSCRNCRYYVPQGRRGGQCSKLNVAVKSGWDACSLAVSPFVPPWNDLSDIMLWQQKALGAQDTVAVEGHSERIRSLESLELEPIKLAEIEIELEAIQLESIIEQPQASPVVSRKGGSY